MEDNLIDQYFNIVEKNNFYSNKKRLLFYLDYLFNGLDLNNKIMLDIGSGFGLFSFYAAVKGANVTCIEPEGDGSSNNQIKIFNSIKSQLKIESIMLYPTTIQNFNDKEKYDIVILHNSINHLDEESCINLKKDKLAIENYSKILSKISNITAKGGKIIITDCSRYNFFGTIGIKNPIAKNIDWKKHQSPELWIKLLRNEGFSNPKVKWTTFNRFGDLGKLFIGNKFAAFFLRSHFHLSMEKK